MWFCRRPRGYCGEWEGANILTTNKHFLYKYYFGSECTESNNALIKSKIIISSHLISIFNRTQRFSVFCFFKIIRFFLNSKYFIFKIQSLLLKMYLPCIHSSSSHAFRFYMTHFFSPSLNDYCLMIPKLVSGGLVCAFNIS